MPRRNIRRRLGALDARRSAALAAAALIALGAAAWAAHSRFVRGLEGFDARPATGPRSAPEGPDPIFRPLTAAQALGLGWAHIAGREPPSSYRLRPIEKKAGTVRVGVFGCSMVEGAETLRGEDVPTRLQELFDRRGYRHVEVVNFGVGAYGVHQTYRLWEVLGRRYELDFLLVEAGPHHLRRDDTFQFEGARYGSIHGRYVLEGEGVRWVPPAGEALDEVRRIYFRMIPPWRYVRYDSRAPALIRMLTPFAPESRANPFYYKKARDADEEMLATYAILFERMRRGSKGFAVLTHPSFGARLRRRSPELEILENPQEPAPMLYRAAMRHPSAAMNRLRAEHLFAYLTGRSGFQASYVHLEPPAAARPAPAARLGDVLSIGGVPIANLVVPRKDLRSPAEDPFPFTEPLGSKPDIRAYLLAPTDFQLVLLPLAAVPRDGARVALAFDLGGTPVQAPLGRLRVSGAAATLRAQSASGEGWTVHRPPPNLLDGLRIEAKRRPGDVRVLIDGRPVLKARVREQGLLTLEPVLGEPVYIRALTGQSLDPETLPGPRGRVDLSATIEGAGASTVPFLAYRIETVRATFESPLRTALRGAR